MARNNINGIKNYKNIESDNIKEEITSICQIKNGIAVGDKKGKVHIYYFKENKLIKDFIIKNKAQTEINYLYSLNNGNLISSNKYELNIYDLASRNNNTIQTFKYINLNEDDRFSDMVINDINDSYNNTYYYQCLELKNSQLLYIDGYELVVLKPTIKNKYQKKDLSNKNKENSLEIDKNIVSITELSDTSFCVCRQNIENNSIIIYDSNSFEEKEKIPIGNLFVKMERINFDIIACLNSFTEKKNFFLILKGGCKKFGNEKYVDQKNVSDIKTETNKLIVAYHTYIKEFNMGFDSGGNYIMDVGKIEIDKKTMKKGGGILTKIYLLNKKFEGSEDKENNYNLARSQKRMKRKISIDEEDGNKSIKDSLQLKNGADSNEEFNQKNTIK